MMIPARTETFLWRPEDRPSLPDLFGRYTENVAKHPDFLKNLLAFVNTHGPIITEVPTVSIGRTVGLNTMPPSDDSWLLVTCKQSERPEEYRTGDITHGTGRTAAKPGGFAAIPLTEKIRHKGIEPEDLKTFGILGKRELYMPLDFKVKGKMLYLTSAEGIMVINLYTREIENIITSPYLQVPHSIEELSSGIFVITGTNADALVLHDPRTHALTPISMWDMGVQTSQGLYEKKAPHDVPEKKPVPIKRINTFTGQELSPEMEILLTKHGFQLYRFDRQKPFKIFTKEDLAKLIETGQLPDTGLPTRYQACHPNSAIEHPGNPNWILTSFLATSEWFLRSGNRKPLQGSGGKIVAINLDNRSIEREVLTNLSNPHQLVYLGSLDGLNGKENYYSYCDSQRGTLVICKENVNTHLEWQIVAEINFSSIPIEGEKKTPWLQSATPSVSVTPNGKLKYHITAYSSDLNLICVVDLEKGTYQFINSGITLPQKAVFIP